MYIKSTAIRIVRNALDRLESKPRMLFIESDDGMCHMPTINKLLRKKYTNKYKARKCTDRTIEVLTTVPAHDIADEIRSWIGCYYDVVVINGAVRVLLKETVKHFV